VTQCVRKVCVGVVVVVHVVTECVVNKLGEIYSIRTQLTQCVRKEFVGVVVVISVVTEGCLLLVEEGCVHWFEAIHISKWTQVAQYVYM